MGILDCVKFLLYLRRFLFVTTYVYMYLVQI